MLVLLCRDATTVLDLVEEAPNHIAIFVQVRAEADRGLAMAFRRDISPCAPFGDVFHPKPKHQWAIIVSGRIELGVSDEETREFNAGSVLNIKDTGSKGHTTRVVGEEDVMMLVAKY
jgi:hypothetical protein